MQTGNLIRCALVLTAAVPLYAHAAPPLGVKPGVWETTTTNSATSITLPQSDMNGMSPEQRAMAENMMKQQQGRPHVAHTQGCLRETDSLDKITSEEGRNPDCKTKVNSQTANSLDMTMTCPAPDPTKAHVKVKALSATHVTFVMDVVTEEGMKIHGTGDSHWVRASCAGLDHQ
jgi:hypothetical protein